jgi:hypothetical protein
LKENVIIGRLIPAGTGLAQYRALEVVDTTGKTVSVLEVPDIPEMDDLPPSLDTPAVSNVRDARALLGGDLPDAEEDSARGEE